MSTACDCFVPDDLQCNTAGRGVNAGDDMIFDCVVEYNVDIADQQQPVLTWFSDTTSPSRVTEIDNPNDGSFRAR